MPESLKKALARSKAKYGAPGAIEVSTSPLPPIETRIVNALMTYLRAVHEADSQWYEPDDAASNVYSRLALTLLAETQGWQAAEMESLRLQLQDFFDQAAEKFYRNHPVAVRVASPFAK